MKYKNDYEVFEDGRIYSYKSKKFMKPYSLGKTYLGVSIHRKPEYVHRIVAECFVKNPNGNPQVNHKDNNKHNNSVDNLEWVTAQENVVHSYTFPRAGGLKKGECYWEGKKRTEETKLKMSLARKKWWSNKKSKVD